MGGELFLKERRAWEQEVVLPVNCSPVQNRGCVLHRSGIHGMGASIKLRQFGFYAPHTRFLVRSDLRSSYICSGSR